MNITLLADSGGSKTDWILLDRQEKWEMQSVGMNPSLVGHDLIRLALRESVAPWLSRILAGRKIKRLIFFGAGLSRKSSRQLLKTLFKTQLETQMTTTCRLTFESDMLGAAYASLGADKGVVGILGTGSVAFRYNGTRITKTRGGLGYLIGDVGGGVALGRVFLRRLVNGDLPKPILKAYPAYSGLEIPSVLEALYSHVAPARFLASQVPFMLKYQANPAIRTLLLDQFSGFLDVYLAAVLKKRDDRMVLMGGVARNFDELLLELCRSRGLKNCSIYHPAPIDGIATYHFENKP